MAGGKPNRMNETRLSYDTDMDSVEEYPVSSTAIRKCPLAGGVQPYLMVIPPRELHFKKIGNDVMAEITLINTSVEQVVFKLQAKSRHKFKAKPCMGILQPGDTENMKVFLKSGISLCCLREENFRIMSFAFHSRDPIMTKAEELWKIYKNVPQQKHELKCFFDDTPGQDSIAYSINAPVIQQNAESIPKKLLRLVSRSNIVADTTPPRVLPLSVDYGTPQVYHASSRNLMLGPLESKTYEAVDQENRNQVPPRNLLRSAPADTRGVVKELTFIASVVERGKDEDIVTVTGGHSVHHIGRPNESSPVLDVALADLIKKSTSKVAGKLDPSPLAVQFEKLTKTAQREEGQTDQSKEITAAFDVIFQRDMHSEMKAKGLSLNSGSTSGRLAHRPSTGNVNKLAFVTTIKGKGESKQFISLTGSQITRKGFPGTRKTGTVQFEDRLSAWNQPVQESALRSNIPLTELHRGPSGAVSREQYLDSLWPGSSTVSGIYLNPNMARQDLQADAPTYSSWSEDFLSPSQFSVSELLRRAVNPLMHTEHDYPTDHPLILSRTGILHAIADILNPVWSPNEIKWLLIDLLLLVILLGLYYSVVKVEEDPCFTFICESCYNDSDRSFLSRLVSSIYKYIRTVF